MRLKPRAPLSDALFKLLGISSRVGYEPDLAESIQPVYVLGTDIPPTSGASSGASAALQYSARVEPLAAAGFFSHAQLFNPATSGVTAYLDWLALTTGAAAQTFLLHHWNAALANLSSTWHTTEGDYSTGALEQRFDQASAFVIPNHPYFTVSIPANATQIIEPPHPIKLPPGFGIIAVPSVVNQQCFFYALGHQVGN